MYLTDKKENIRRELRDHEDLEILLETFAKQVEEVVNEAENIQVRPHSLDHTRLDLSTRRPMFNQRKK